MLVRADSIIEAEFAVPSQDAVQLWVGQCRDIILYQDQQEIGEQTISVHEAFLQNLIDALISVRDQLKVLP